MNVKLCVRQMYIRFRSVLSVSARYGMRILRKFLEDVKRSRYPIILQLPITFKCNFDCVMCGMKKLIHKPGFTPLELENILSDSLFSKIRSVGVNGGEPFLLNDINEYITVILNTLSELEDLYIISNGYMTDKILEKSAVIVEMCRDRNVRYHLSVSLDGFGAMQDRMRGKSGAFEHTALTCRRILENREKYCDTFGTICTVTKINADFLPEIDTWAKMNSIPIGFNIATIHERISNADKFNDFSVFTDEHARMMTEEFFYSKYKELSSEVYYSLFYYTHTQHRLSSCVHKTGAVTLTPDGQIAYCATHSAEIGDASSNSAEKIFFSNKNLKYSKALHEKYCDNCSHYADAVELKYYLPVWAKERLRSTRIF